MLCLLMTQAGIVVAAETLHDPSRKPEDWAHPIAPAAPDSNNPYAERRNLVRAQEEAEQLQPPQRQQIALPPPAALMERPAGIPNAVIPNTQAVQTVTPVIPAPPQIVADSAPQAATQVTAAEPAEPAQPETRTEIVARSPDPIIRKAKFHFVPPADAQPVESPSPTNLAELAPSAGPDPNTLVPLIPSPDQLSQGAPIEPMVISAPPAVAEDASAPQLGSAAVASMLDSLDEPVSASERPEILPGVAANAKMDKSEPEPSLSSESKRIVTKIPANIDKPKQAPEGPLNVEHGRDTEYISATAPVTGATDTATHESMGIKIEIKRPAMNLNYELEKAYSALISGQADEAIKIYKNVLSNAPDNKLALFGLATTYHRAGQIDLARPLYGKLLALDPDNRDALNNFLVLLADESPQEALTQLEKLEERNPAFSPIPAQMAVIYQKLGDSEKASEKMFKAISLAPENLTYRYNLAIMLDKQNKYDEAAKLYRQILEAHLRGQVIPGEPTKIQERLTFISSNRH